MPGQVDDVPADRIRQCLHQRRPGSAVLQDLQPSGGLTAGDAVFQEEIFQRPALPDEAER